MCTKINFAADPEERKGAVVPNNQAFTNAMVKTVNEEKDTVVCSTSQISMISWRNTTRRLELTSLCSETFFL